MFDHVAIAVTDLARSERFYRTLLGGLGLEPSYAGADFVEWEDFDIGPADARHPVTRNLHIAFRAPDAATADAVWRDAVNAGHLDDGAPGPRPEYGPDYYGAFLLDPDGNSVEAVVDGERPGVPTGWIDHLWLRVRDVEASARFYGAIAPHAGLTLAEQTPERARFTGADRDISFLSDGRGITEPLHIAFSADENSAVDAFHATAVSAGYEDHGAPGERAQYHPGYYGAFVLDPDGHNVEVVNHNR
jgi:catechol 2,3-dioxygenase-like lactoylglutathione lyase family enzyme